MKKPIAIAVSGGIDSLMSAHLLQQEGHEVFGLHFITGYEPPPANSVRLNLDTDATSTPGPHRQIETRINALARQLHIPVHIIDLSHEFQTGVVDYFTRTYLAGQTPNPCLVCNPAIKFGALLKHARGLGADQLATGHYARKIKAADGTWQLHKGTDPRKDQSYFLAFLNQAQLSRACFPLGSLTKSEVKARAARLGLKPVTPQESQDICFVPRAGYGTFLSSQPGFKDHPGPIVDMTGNLIGQHHGLYRFTVGQRRGINCPAAEPFYVIRLDPARNRLIVGAKHDLLQQSCLVTGVNWIQPQPPQPFAVWVRIRYRHQATPAVISIQPDQTVRVTFDTPQRAITPGQGAVFYDDTQVLGGGWIAPSAAADTAAGESP